MALRTHGIYAERHHSGLRAKAAWRPYRHDDLLEADRRSRNGLGASLRDREEVRGFQAGAADQRAVDVDNRHQFRRVRRLDGTAIEDPHPGPLPLEARHEGIPDKAMNLLDILSSRRQSGADRPDRLIGDHQIGRRRAVGQRSPELAAADIQRLAAVALMPGLADADDGDTARAPNRFRLLPHQRVAFAMIGAPLGMSDDD